MCLAISRRCATGSMAQIRPAPATFRQASVSSPIGPAPYTATVSPGFTSANFMECAATASGSARVANSSESEGGIGSRFTAGRFTNSRKNPGMPGLLKKRMLAQTL